jgi:hypothetical protein
MMPDDLVTDGAAAWHTDDQQVTSRILSSSGIPCP